MPTNRSETRMWCSECGREYSVGDGGECSALCSREVVMASGRRTICIWLCNGKWQREVPPIVGRLVRLPFGMGRQTTCLQALKNRMRDAVNRGVDNFYARELK